MSKLIITNGDSAASFMLEAGFDELILPWRDILHDGPVPSGTTFRELSSIRIDYLTRQTGINREKIWSHFQRRQAILSDYKQFKQITLWFEHDLYDQLQLLQILNYFYHCPDQPFIYLVQSGNHLSKLSMNELVALKDHATLVTLDQYQYAVDAWYAFTGEDPTHLQTFIYDPAPLPFVPAALHRLLQEFPHLANGLNRTQQTTLNQLDRQSATVAELFHYIQLHEADEFMGDLSYGWLMDDMVFCSNPLITGITEPINQCSDDPRTYFCQSVHITPTGRSIFQHEINHIELNGIDRWIGGTHLTPNNLYVWNEPENKLVFLTREILI